MLAMRLSAPGMRAGIVLVNLADNSVRLLARSTDADIEDVFWLNTKRLGYTVTYSDTKPGETSAGLYAADTDGTKVVGLAPAVIAKRSFAESEGFVGPEMTPPSAAGLDLLNSDNMLVMFRYEDEQDSRLGSLNTRSRERNELNAPDGTFNLIVGADRRGRVALTRDGAQHALVIKNGFSWRKLATFAPLAANAVMPLLYDGTLYVQSRNGGDRVGIYTYDIAAAALAKAPLVAAPDFDIEGHRFLSQQRMAGVDQFHES